MNYFYSEAIKVYSFFPLGYDHLFKGGSTSGRGAVLQVHLELCHFHLSEKIKVQS